MKLKHDTENSESVGGSVAVGDSIAKAGAVLGVVVDKMQLQRIGNLLQERERKTQRVEVDSDSIIISLDIRSCTFEIVCSDPCPSEVPQWK